MTEAILKCFQVLGLSQGATPDEVKLAYRDLVRVWHPDRFGSDERLRMKADEKLREINASHRAVCEYLQRNKPDSFASQPVNRANEAVESKGGAIRNLAYLDAIAPFINYRSVFEAFDDRKDSVPVSFDRANMKKYSEAITGIFRSRLVTLNLSDNSINHEGIEARGVVHFVNRAVTINRNCTDAGAHTTLLALIYIRDILTLSGLADLKQLCSSALAAYGWNGTLPFVSKEYLSAEKQLAQHIGILSFETLNAAGRKSFSFWLRDSINLFEVSILKK